MNEENIALVRATDFIPFDGIVHPISNVPYLKKENGTFFSYAINDLLRKLSIINEVDYWSKTEEEQEEINKNSKKILNQYLPYNSNYNSMVLWSLNGLVPDDQNKSNTFSNKTCAIIESLEEQLESSEIISLVPTDTAIKGDVKLSNKSIILISKERYGTLSQEEKERLKMLDLTVQVFDGTLEDAVKQTLKDNGYRSETLSLTRSKGGYASDKAKDLIEEIKGIAEKEGIAEVLYDDIVKGTHDELKKLNSVKDVYENTRIVMECYQKTFFRYVFSKMEIDLTVKNDVLNYMDLDSEKEPKDLCHEIEKNGLDEYKKIVGKYNYILEQLQKQGKLPTPEQIVNITKKDKSFNLISLIEEYEKQESKEILDSAVETTKVETRTSDLNKASNHIKVGINEKENVEKITEEAIL